MAKNFTNKQIGKLGENLACDYLKNRGFEILETNFRYSRQAEIDIIAQKNKILHFVEVKTRSQVAFGSPLEAIDTKKLSSIFRCAAYYMQKNQNKYKKFQIDAVGILLLKDGKTEFTFVEDISL